jgi:ATP-dependent RNA helicase DDX47/RRP3
MASGEQPLSDADRAAASAAFRALGVCEQLADAAAALGWRTPTPIQEAAVPAVLRGQDVVGLAQTGSGKTGAFALPILQALLDKPSPFFALVLSPTRELAIQIAEQFEALGAGAGVRCAVLVGGVDMMAQALALGRRPHVLVGTPGRVVDHLTNTKGFSIRGLAHLVLDEADRLLNMDFEQEIDAILKAAPRERRTQLFSATMTSKVAKLQRACLRDPVRVEVASKYATVDTLRQQYLFVPAKHKDCYLALLLTELAGASAIVFARTCDAARRLALLLRNLGFGAVPIHGQMGQPKRLAALNKFKAGERAILVATDVASRGLDIPAVDLVVNYDVPSNSKDYVHRVGRTARAGRSGRAVTIATQYDVEGVQRIEAALGATLESYPAEAVAALVLAERVNEAGRIAALQMREADARRKGAGEAKAGKRQSGSGGGGDTGGDDFKPRRKY